MIDKSQLGAYRTFKDPYQIEKDYLQDLLLYGIYKLAGSGFVFKGGTALSKVYHTDRFSEDIDFTLHGYGTGDFGYEGKDGYEFVKLVVDKAVSGIEYKTGYLKEPSMNEFGTVSMEIGIEGPRFSGRRSTLQHISFEVSTMGSVLIKPKPAPIVPVYAGAFNYVAMVMDPAEILSEKIRAVSSEGRRHKERDLYDMYVLFGKGFVPDKKIVKAKFNKAAQEFSYDVLRENVLRIKDTWQALEPFVQHVLENYEYTSDYVMSALRAANLDERRR